MKYADILRDQAAKLAEEREQIKVEAEALGAVIVTEERSASPEEDEELSKLAARSKTLKDEIDAKLARADELDVLAEERTAAPTFIRPTEKAHAADVARMSHQQLVDTVIRGVEERDIDSSNARALLKRHRGDVAWARQIAARSTDAYASAFVKMISGREMFLTDEEKRAAINVGTNTNGGYLVPTFLDPTVILTNNGSSNAIRALARVVTLTTGNAWTGITSAGVTASWDAQLAEVSDDSPNDFDKPSVPLHKGAAFVQASLEAFEDIDNLASDVLMMFADARDRLEGAAHATGSGNGQPTGIFTALDANAACEITSTTAATIGLVDLQGMKRAVPVRFRGQGTWVMNPVYADAVKALGTSTGNLFSTDITQANTTTLLGRPIVESDDAPATQTTTVKDNEVVYGDFSNYLIVDKPGSLAIQFIPTLFNTSNNLPDGRSGWYMTWRSGADSINDVAFRLLQDKTSA